MSSHVELPLRGTLVVELGMAFSLPGAAMMLAALGADVIKVEPLEGENVRHGLMAGNALKFGDQPEGQCNPVWLAMNRGKRSLAIDLKAPEGITALKKLLLKADVFMHNSRPGAMERLGLGYDDLKTLRPEIVYCELSGYGDRGPLARLPGGDLWAQALTGIVHQQGYDGAEPRTSGTLLVDQEAMPLTAVGILAALMQRQATGRGQKVSTSLMQAALYQQVAETASLLVDNKPAYRSGRGWQDNFPYGAYQAKDRQLVTISGFGDQWARFCEVLGIPEVGADPRYDTPAKRQSCRAELYSLLDRAFVQRTADEWLRIFKEARFICMPCLTHAEFFAHPQAVTNEVVEEFDDPDRGRIRGLAFPLKFDGEAPPALGSAPRLGADSAAILSELGYGPREIADMLDRKIIAGVS